ncbi:MAG: diphosphomevalonate decarboxylase [Proteobacteria bacterium]|nr:diphosphomevalonate decarboxylase [Pseudomonadota bacterium]
MKKWFAEAPSNIALIKYMGKEDPAKNIPINASLSYTLNDLLSFVELESYPGPNDIWEPLDLPGTPAFSLTPEAKERFLRHLTFLKNHFSYSGNFIVRSCNNFPQSTGLASSASSFAALTQCAARALCELTNQEEISIEKIAELSRVGSGSSCRSFFSPWCLWTKHGVEPIALPYDKLIHQAVIVSHEFKPVHSTDAHKLVRTSPLFANRAERAEENLKLLIQSLKEKNWTTVFEIVWRDFWDMHQMFESSVPPLHYMKDDTKKVLNNIKKYWDDNKDGPLATVDAGANIHLLYRPDQKDKAEFIKTFFLNDYDVL